MTVIEIYCVEETATYYDCDQCDYVTTKKLLLKFHVQAKYEGLRFPCDHRGYKATQKHTGIVFNFDKYKAWVKIELLDQTRSIHDKNPYLCDICDIVGMSKKIFKTYKRNVYKNQVSRVSQGSHRLFQVCFLKYLTAYTVLLHSFIHRLAINNLCML